MEKVRIVFSDETEIMAEQNGSCYITDEKPDFPTDLSVVTIDEQVMENVKLIECAGNDGRYWFSFCQMTSEEIWRAEIEDVLCEFDELIQGRK